MTSTLTPVGRPARYLPAYQAVEAYRGDDFAMPWTITRVENGIRTPVPVDGWVFTAQLRYDPDTEPAITDFTIDGAMSPSGLIILTLAQATMQVLPIRTQLWWDLQRVKDGLTKTLIAGPFTVVADITKP